MVRVFGIFIFFSFFIGACSGSESVNPTPNNKVSPTNPTSSEPESQIGESSDLEVNRAIGGVWKADNTIKCSDGTSLDESHYSSIIMTVKNGILQTVNDLFEPTGCQKTVSVPFKISVISRSDVNEVKGLDVLLGEGKSSYSAACHSPGRRVVESSSIHINIISNSSISVDEAPDRFSSCLGLSLTRSYSRIQ